MSSPEPGEAWREHAVLSGADVIVLHPGSEQRSVGWCWAAMLDMHTHTHKHVETSTILSCHPGDVIGEQFCDDSHPSYCASVVHLVEQWSSKLPQESVASFRKHLG